VDQLPKLYSAKQRRYSKEVKVHPVAWRMIAVMIGGAMLATCLSALGQDSRKQLSADEFLGPDPKSSQHLERVEGNPFAATESHEPSVTIPQFAAGILIAAVAGATLTFVALRRRIASSHIGETTDRANESDSAASRSSSRAMTWPRRVVLAGGVAMMALATVNPPLEYVDPRGHVVGLEYDASYRERVNAPVLALRLLTVLAVTGMIFLVVAPRK
jgi:hypothetical protein